MEDWKLFVVKLCELNSSNTSKEIAGVINKFSKIGSPKVSSASVAAVKANWARRNK
jgi:hypothetical protein